MNQYHQQIISLIKKRAASSPIKKQNESYHGTKSILYGLTAAEKLKIAREFKEKYPEIPFNKFIDLLHSLNEGKSHEEKTLVGTLISLYRIHRKNLNPRLYDKWLNNLSGWAEIDCYCQSAFSADEIASNWKDWKKLLINFSKSKNISKKRASLVFLIRPVRETNDHQFTQLALENIDRLKHEKDIIITKAISWLLREMVKQNRKLVREYLNKNESSLPKIAVRETRNKLKTGRK